MVFGVSALIICGCQTSYKKNVAIVEDRVDKLKPLSDWSAVKCEVKVSLTEPARARFKEMFPKDKIKEPWIYTWKAREVACEVHPHKSTKKTEAQKTFLETAFCVLLQTHFVNSPFDQLRLSDDAVKNADQFVQLKTSLDNDVGIFLSKNDFIVETRTKSRGQLEVKYTEQNKVWVPTYLAHHDKGAILSLNDFDYKFGPRQALKSFWIFIGQEQPLRHSIVEIKNCKRD